MLDKLRTDSFIGYKVFYLPSGTMPTKLWPDTLQATARPSIQNSLYMSWNTSKFPKVYPGQIQSGILWRLPGYIGETL